MRSVFILVTASLCLFSAENRIVQPVDPSRTVPLKRHLRPEVAASIDLGAVDPAMLLQYATLRLSPADGLEAFLTEQRNPRSPNYHRWLTPEQFGERFGLSPNDLTQIVSWLTNQGLQVHDVARGRHWITFSGTAERVGRAFHTQIHRYRVNGETHFANATDPAIPAAFENVVAGIEGLDDFQMQPSYALEQPRSTTGGTHYIAPDDFATIYNLAPLYSAGLDGKGQSIAVIGRSDVNLADIRQFRQVFNLPANDPQVVLFGPDPGTTSSLIESDLDLEWAGAVARNATIIYVNSNSVNTSAQYAVDQNLAPVITFSYGGCEAFNSGSLRGIAQQANAEGITWLTASGDWGAATCDVTAPAAQVSKGPNASFPASIPEITAVGGTEFNDGSGTGYWAAANTANGASALTYVPEKAWNDSAVRNDLSAGGGGPSVLYSKPVWQAGPGVPNDNARDTPDLALAASPQHYAYIVYSGGSMAHVGGTSAASPSFAGMLAILNQYLVSNGSLAQPGLGNINPALYRLAQATSDVFHDITAGDINLPCEQGSPACTAAGMGYAAGPGYDLATGLGSVDAYHLVMEWNAGSASTTTVSANPPAFSLSDTVQLTATVSGQGGQPSGTVAFVANDTTMGAANLNSSGTAALSVAASLIAAGNGAVTAVYSGDPVFTSSSGTTSTSLNLPASGSLVVPFVIPNSVPEELGSWPYTVGLTEKAGVATTLTSFTIDGVSQNLGSWTSTSIPAKGTVRANLSGVNLNAPLNRNFVFAGKDADGTPWSTQLSVPFIAGTTLAPAMTLTSAPTAVQQNSGADPSCQWSQQVSIQETGGFLVQLTRFTAGGTDLSNQIQNLFGTTRLAPYGMLQANLCWDSNSVSAAKNLQISGTSELGNTVSASVSATYSLGANAAPTVSVSPAAVNLTVGGTASLAVGFEGAAVPWTASILPANRTSSWLAVTPNGSTVTLQASTNGLANGVYRAFVSIQAPNAVPQQISVPVTLLVGGSPAISIAGMRDNASGTEAFAPGMQVAVFGSGLAPVTQATSRLPLPLNLNGVSATVNGISAPLYFVSDGQVNLQIPYETGSGPAVLAINNNGAIASFSFPVAAAAPGIYSALIDATTGARGSAQPGDVMTIFITGAGDLSPTLATGATPAASTSVRNLPKPRLPLSVTLGGEQASVAFAGNASGLVGVTQINFTVPSDATPGDQPLVVTVGGASSGPVMLTINAPPN